MMTRKSTLIFLRAQVGAFLGGISDYSLMIMLTEWMDLHFTVSILISGTIGGLVNFYINRQWAFKAKNGYVLSGAHQLFRFVMVVLGSISLKSGGTYLLHRFLNIDYRIGRLMIDLSVSYSFNYPLMRFWVFKTGPKYIKLNSKSS